MLISINLLFFFASGCSNKEVKEAVYPGQVNDENNWLVETYNFIDNSYIFNGDSKTGGYYNSLKVREYKEINEFNVNSTYWYIKTLDFLKAGNALKDVDKELISTKLLESWESRNDQFPNVYYYWILLGLYSSLEIQIPASIKDFVYADLKKYTDKDGYYIENDEYNPVIYTIFSIRIQKLLNRKIEHQVDIGKIKDSIDEAIVQKDKELLIENTLLYIELISEDKNNLEIKEKISVFLEDNFNWSEEDLSNLDYIYNYIFINNSFGLNHQLPKSLIKNLNDDLNKSINNNDFVDGAIIYQLVTSLEGNLDENILIKYILDNRNQFGLWGNPIYKVPELKETYYALSFYKMNGIELDQEKVKAIENYYNQISNQGKISHSDFPYLKGIGFWLNEYGLKEDLEKLNKIDLEKTPIEKQAEIYLLLNEVYSFYQQPADDFLKRLQVNLNNSTVEKSNFTFISELGMLLAEIKKDRDEINKIQGIYSDYYVDGKGYKISKNTANADLMTTYYGFLVQHELGLELNNLSYKAINQYKVDKGYSLLNNKDDFYNIQFTFYGFSLRKMLEGVKEPNDKE